MDEIKQHIDLWEVVDRHTGLPNSQGINVNFITVFELAYNLKVRIKAPHVLDLEVSVC